jgi:hypothetical protein
MRREVAAFLLSSFLVFASANSAFTQRNSQGPFVAFDETLNKEPGGWNGNKERLSRAFNAERIRLGKDFEKELFTYLGLDVERHYWISSFLEDAAYLHGSAPLPHLALLIKQQGLSLLRGKTDEESRGYAVGLNVTASLLAADIGLMSLAISYRNEAEKMMSEDPLLKTHFPAVGREEKMKYEALGRLTNEELKRSYKFMQPCYENSPESKAVVSAGLLDGRALNKPLSAAYPPIAWDAHVSGVVKVKVVFDESGKVIWACPVEGPQLLLNAAKMAAYNAKFQPVLLNGKAVTVSGFLTFKFVRH